MITEHSTNIAEFGNEGIAKYHPIYAITLYQTCVCVCDTLFLPVFNSLFLTLGPVPRQQSVPVPGHVRECRALYRLPRTAAVGKYPLLEDRNTESIKFPLLSCYNILLNLTWRVQNLAFIIGLLYVVHLGLKLQHKKKRKN